MRNELLRRLAARAMRVVGSFAVYPFRFRKNRIPAPTWVGHAQWPDYLAEKFNKEGVRILEIGSRDVTGHPLRSKFPLASYTGFDFYPGNNVDIAGDVHRLSSYFPPGEKFDLVFSSAVFEHLHMPWVVAIEISKVLAVGGFVFVETHFSFSSHERPWHFFQFSDMGLRSLFNRSLGFDLIDSGMSNPIVGYFDHTSDRNLRYRPVAELYCHSGILCRKRCDHLDFDWTSVDIDGVVEGSRYPPP